jgi:hypothetical protein
MIAQKLFKISPIEVEPDPHGPFAQHDRVGVRTPSNVAHLPPRTFRIAAKKLHETTPCLF